MVSASSPGPSGLGLDLEAAQLLVPDAGGEGFRFRRRVFVVAVNDVGDVDVDGLCRLLAHQRGHAQLALDDLHLDQLLQREQVVILGRRKRKNKIRALAAG